MANHKLLDRYGSCRDICTYARQLCLPERENCTPSCMDWIIRDCEQVWNCRRKQSEKAYFHPVVDGDLIMFQTKMFDAYNVDRENPVSGWGDAITLEVYDAQGSLITNDYTTVSTRVLYGWDGDNTYQLIEIDTSLINSECFNLRWQSFNTLDEVQEEYCSEDFKKVLCEETVLVKSTYCTTDCCNNWYGDPVAFVNTDGSFRYNNQGRYYALFIPKTAGNQRTSFNNITTKTEVRLNAELILTQLIPPNISDMLISQHLSGEEIYIDGEQWYSEGVQADNRSRGRMQMYNVELFNECENDFRCC